MTETTRIPAAVDENANSRATNIGLWMLQVVAAAVFAYVGVAKLMAPPTIVQTFTAMGLGATGMYVIGVLELAGAVALLIPRLAGLAALCFVGLLLGAQIITAVVFGLSPLVAAPTIPLLVAVVIAWGRRGSLHELARLARR
jgi:uncharacterized membrane protein YphA (DoxX/SURF4 family)